MLGARPNFPAACPSDWMLGPQTWGRHPNIYLPDFDSKPVCDLNIVIVNAGRSGGGEWGPKTQPCHRGRGHEISSPRNICDKVSACIIYLHRCAPSTHLPEPPNKSFQFSFLLHILYSQADPPAEFNTFSHSNT